MPSQREARHRHPSQRQPDRTHQRRMIFGLQPQPLRQPQPRHHAIVQHPRRHQKIPFLARVRIPAPGAPIQWRKPVEQRPRLAQRHKDRRHPALRAAQPQPPPQRSPQTRMLHWWPRQDRPPRAPGHVSAATTSNDSPHIKIGPLNRVNGRSSRGDDFNLSPTSCTRSVCKATAGAFTATTISPCR